jgi:1A family penicillin-binding protein
MAKHSARSRQSRVARFREWLRGRTPRDRVWFRRVKRLAYVLIPAGFLLALLLFGIAYALVRVPQASDFGSGGSTILLDRHGHQIARLHAEASRVDVPFKEMPETIRQAVIAAEDRGFYHHSGISIPSIIRAALANITGGEIKQGGSTITQQYVKNAYVGRQRTIWRKMKEAIIAIKLERQQSKDQILEAYLNTIYFGRGAYGIEAASRTYFGTSARTLTLEQAALLAGIIRSPENYDPVKNPALAKKRRDFVLDAMVKTKAITQAEADGAAAQPVRVLNRKAAAATSLIGAYFVEDVRRELIRRFGSARVYRGGLIVHTTLDLGMQRYAEDAVRSILDKPDDPQAALVAIEPDSGAVLAMVGGRTYSEQQYNLATQGRRQPGSAFKPFVLTTALAEKLSIRSQFSAPAKITLHTGFKPWTVANYDHRDYGNLDLLRATENSVNTVYAQLILKVGPKATATTAENMGIASKLAPVPSLTLGTSIVSPLELDGAYTAFATGGMHVTPHLITRVQDASKHTLFTTDAKSRRVIEARVADTVAYALQQVVRVGTGTRAQLGSRPVGGKTGTTEEHTDAWFAGFTRQIATTVWMGFPEGGRNMNHVRGIAVTGGSFPARIWKAFMEKATQGMPEMGFGRPSFSGQTMSPSPTGSPSATPSPTASASLPPTLPPVPTPSTTKPPKPTPTPTGTGSPSPHPTASPAGGGG